LAIVRFAKWIFGNGVFFLNTYKIVYFLIFWAIYACRLIVTRGAAPRNWSGIARRHFALAHLIFINFIFVLKEWWLVQRDGDVGYSVWPDEFLKSRPKCSPTHFLSKLIDSFYFGRQ
jgi:hypothetical protein